MTITALPSEVVAESAIPPSSGRTEKLGARVADELAVRRVGARIPPTWVASTTPTAITTTATASAIHRVGCFTPAPAPARASRSGAQGSEICGAAGRGTSASAVPSTITPPPIQIHTTIGLTATPIVTRPAPAPVGEETSVRYTSRRNPVRTDGVPIAVVEPGKMLTDGA